MFLFSTKELEIVEYDPQTVTTPRVHLRALNNGHSPLEFNGTRLAFAIAATMTKKTLSTPELWSDAFATWIGINQLVSSDKNFKFREDRLTRLKDFIRTAKVGEVAQGISYLWAQDKLGYKTIVDFEQFFEDNGIQVPSRISTPDFIMQKNITTQVGILESKGTEINSTTTIKGILKDALLQCTSGSNFANQNGYVVVNKYAACTEFSTDAVPDNSTFHFVDPEKPEIDSQFDDRIFKYHFASWFYLIADFENVNRLLRLENIQLARPYYIIRQIKGEDYYIVNTAYFRRRIFENLSKYFATEIISIIRLLLRTDNLFERRISIGISKKIIDHLTGETRLTSFPDFDTLPEEGWEFFTDGIIINLNATLA